jgi:hypothetical protein
VEEVSDEAARSLGADFAVAGREGALAAAADRAGFHSPAWTVFDHLHTVSLLLNTLTAGIASVFTVFTGALDRTRGQEVRAEHFRQRVNAAIPDLRMQVAAAVRKAYADLAGEVCGRLRTAQEEELARIEAELGQALLVHDKGAGRIVEAGAALADVVARVDASARELADLRRRLRAVAAS